LAGVVYCTRSTFRFFATSLRAVWPTNLISHVGTIPCDCPLKLRNFVRLKSIYRLTHRDDVVTFMKTQLVISHC